MANKRCGNHTSCIRWPISCGGYTLLEVLVAVTILGIVVGMVFSNFGAGIMSYKIGTKRGGMVQEARGGLRLVGSDIERMLPIRDGSGVFSQNAFSFIRITPSQKSGLEVISYNLQEGSLSRNTSPYSDKSDSGKSESQNIDSGSIQIIKGIKAAEFLYLDGAEWIPEIKEKGKYPDAVQIKLTLQDSGEDASFRTAYFFPLETKKDKEKEK